VGCPCPESGLEGPRTDLQDWTAHRAINEDPHPATATTSREKGGGRRSTGSKGASETRSMCRRGDWPQLQGGGTALGGGGADRLGLVSCGRGGAVQACCTKPAGSGTRGARKYRSAEHPFLPSSGVRCAAFPNHRRFGRQRIEGATRPRSPSKRADLAPGSDSQGPLASPTFFAAWTFRTNKQLTGRDH